MKRLGNLAGPRVLVSRGLCRVGGGEARTATGQGQCGWFDLGEGVRLGSLEPSDPRSAQQTTFAKAPDFVGVADDVTV